VLACCHCIRGYVKIFTWEAVQIDGSEEVEELDSVFGELGKVLVDHFECALKHVLHDDWDLVFHQCLGSC